jgi:uncharacterized protein (TIGR02246 family)
MSYLLRLWQTEHDRALVWRASLESASGSGRPGKRRGFASLDELFEFLERETAQITKEANVEAELTAIKEVLNQYAIGCNTGDFDLWISLWADEGVQMPPGAPARVGKEQIRAAMKPAFDQMNLDIVLLGIQEAKVSGDSGLTRCTYTLKMTPKAGGETINAMPDGKALTLYEKQSDGSWKIVYDCFNSSTSDH